MNEELVLLQKSVLHGTVGASKEKSLSLLFKFVCGSFDISEERREENRIGVDGCQGEGKKGNRRPQGKSLR